MKMRSTGFMCFLPKISPGTFWQTLAILFSLLLLAGCAAAASSPVTPAASATLVPSVTFTKVPTDTPTPTPTAIRTPPALPGLFQTSLLDPLDPPHTYVSDTCQYLQDKWSSNKSVPGTVVMPIMFHSIGGITGGDRISEADFHALMQALHDNGFQAITTTQLAGFLEGNAIIPQRSVMLIVDDRRARYYYDTLFRPYWEEYGWPVVNAWISLDDSIGAQNLPDHVSLEAEGWVDHQAHGFQHFAIEDSSSADYINQELQKPIDVFQENFHKKPLAIIWPGGGFTPHAAAVARQLGYQLGFTINPRGPLLFNWIPLSDAKDPRRPSWIPEGPVNDPLLVLPRFWDSDAIVHLNDVIQIGQEAAVYAGQNKAVELEYYDILCSPALGSLP
jgi:peptidoglycan/xylan/chitin deacetylase (PgdA/CDA1 family)